MRLPISLGLVLLSLVGCDAANPATQSPQPPAQTHKKKPQHTASPGAKKVEVGRNVFLEVFPGGQRSVLINSYVCLRQGMLEQFLTRRGTKEHEAILAADVDARDIHTALTLAGAEAGSPVKFQPRYEPAAGTPIKIFVEYSDKDQKHVRLPAQHWVRDIKTKKDLDSDWVFAGSLLFSDPSEPNRKPLYAANDGDVICVSNFETALLDLPINSSKENDELLFEAATERIPDLQTPVQVILEPVVKRQGN